MLKGFGDRVARKFIKTALRHGRSPGYRMEYSPQRNVSIGYEFNSARGERWSYLETERQLMFAATLGRINNNAEAYRSFHSAAELARDKHILLECGGSCSHRHYTGAKSMAEMRD